MTHVALTSFRNRIVVDVDDAVEIEGHNFSNVVKLLEVIHSIFDERWEGDGGKVADGYLVWSRVFDNLGTEVRGFNGTEVLLVGLAVCSVFVEHERSARFDLGLHDGEEELLGFDGLAALSLTLVPVAIVRQVHLN